jgi:hypothetical protein
VISLLAISSCGHTSKIQYTTPINDLAELRNKITQKINEINNNPTVLENVTNAIKRRTRLCLQEQGAHFQHLL